MWGLGGGGEKKSQRLWWHHVESGDNVFLERQQSGVGMDMSFGAYQTQLHCLLAMTLDK